MDIVIFGTGQLADVVVHYLQRHAEVRIVAYTVDQAFIKAPTHAGVPLVAWETLEQEFPPEQVLLFGPVSFRDGNRFRRERYLAGKQRGYRFYTFLHPAAHVYTEQIGENVLVLEGNTLQPFSSVGDNCVIWSNNHIGHHTSLGAHCFVAGHVGLGGNTRVEEGVFFAGRSGAVDNLQIGAWSLLMPSAVAVADLPSNAVLSAPKPRVIENAARRAAKRLRGLGKRDA